MAVIYTDTTNKYDLSLTALNETAKARSFIDLFFAAFTPVESVINEGIDKIGSWISQFQLNKNTRRKNEQNSLLELDKAGYEAESRVNLIVLAVIILVVIIFAAKFKK